MEYEIDAVVLQKVLNVLNQLPHGQVRELIDEIRANIKPIEIAPEMTE